MAKREPIDRLHVIKFDEHLFVVRGAQFDMLPFVKCGKDGSVMNPIATPIRRGRMPRRRFTL